MKLCDMTALSLAARIRDRRLSAPELLEELLAGIDRTEPSLHAYLATDPDRARADARAVQARIDSGTLRSPLAGVPIALKDNICTDHLRTTCASRMLADYLPPYCATAAEKLRDGDMILHGKLNMDEFAMGSTTETSYFGATANPWDTTRVPGGSSGGAAAAVAAGAAVCALGSDTGGSIRQPASHCGVTGFLPTYGTVSRYGLIAYASSLEQIGPIARDVADCAALMDIIRGRDACDATSRDSTGEAYLHALHGDVRGLRIGLLRDALAACASPDVPTCITQLAAEYEKAGAIIKDVNFPLTEAATAAYYIIATAEAASNLSRYDGIKYGHRAQGELTLTDLYTQSRTEGFGEEVKRRILLGNFVLSAGYYDAYYQRAARLRAQVRRAFDAIWQDVDVLLLPTAPTAAPRRGELLADSVGMYRADRFTVLANLAGLPALTLPCGQDRDGLPIGAQLIGQAGDDARVLAAGHAIQRRTDHHLCRPKEVST